MKLLLALLLTSVSLWAADNPEETFGMKNGRYWSRMLTVPPYISAKNGTPEDAMKIPFLAGLMMGHSTVTVSQEYVHPLPEAVELAFGRLMTLNLQRVGTNMGTVEQAGVIEIQ